MRESAVVSNDARRRDVGDGERAGQELTRRNFLKAGGGVLAGVYALQLAGCGQRGVPRQPDRPNILFLMADQYRWDALGSVDSLVKTPNLDSLAARGISFGRATVNAPMCLPSRYSLMTGLYPSQVGVRHNAQMCPTDEDLPVPVLAQRLREAGYQTAGFGKTHWYLGEDLAPNIPVKTSTRGFEVRAQRNTDEPGRVEPGAVQMGHERPEAYAALDAETRPFGTGETAEAYKGFTSSVPPQEHIEAWLTDKALDFLDGGREEGKPFFVYLSFDFPHAPFNVPPGYEELYDIDEIPPRPTPPEGADLAGHAGEEWWGWEEWLRETTPLERRRSTLRYYALCSYVDEQFGRVLRRLEEMGEAENTFVVFTSDHGEMLGDRRRFSKYCLYEGSVRVPLMVAGPNVPAHLRGTVDYRPAELVDVLPTLLSVAGETIPPESPGASLLDEPVRAGCFTEMHGTGYEKIQKAPAYMWRTNDWKLITYLPGDVADAGRREPRGELYDLHADPHEYENLYEDPGHLSVRERLTGDLLMHLASIWAKYPWQAAKPQLG
ncbi:MAG: sulfatase-like hydrolase/transferase [Actinomycetota bacterium]|nr:sulfatase-like hydrolase/transferase [Actinomycetota bacterium]